MDGSIAASLSGIADLSVGGIIGRAGVGASAADSDDSFAAQLEAGFRARAEQLGLELPEEEEATTPADVTSDDAWMQAQLRSAAMGNGPGDAMLQVMADAANARYERRHSGRSDDLFDS